MENYDEQQISTFDLVIKLLLEKKLNLDGLITHRFKLENYRNALEVVTKKEIWRD